MKTDILNSIFYGFFISFIFLFLSFLISVKGNIFIGRPASIEELRIGFLVYIFLTGMFNSFAVYISLR